MFLLFSTGVNDTGDKLAVGVNNTSGIGGKFATSVVDPVANFPEVQLTLAAKFSTVSLTLVANLPVVSFLILVLHLDLQISPGIVKKI